MLPVPFYDNTKTYEENYEKGPFGDFKKTSNLKEKGNPRSSFLGNKVFTPFGIPAGPLINSNFVKSAFDWGFDIATYKTVRSDTFPCHPFPNVLFVEAPDNLYPLEVLRLKASKTTKRSKEKINITNSFGVPSRRPEVWQEDVKKAISYAKLGQVLVLSFMGTVREGQTPRQFVADFAKAAKFAKETGAKVLEANLSCPNIGNEGLVCYNLEATKEISKAIRRAIGSTPLILKVGYYQNPAEINKVAQIADKYADGISSINTLQTEIVDSRGKQALPGKNRLRSGVCGDSIKWAGLVMSHSLSYLKKRNNYKYTIIGVGGVMNAKDYKEYTETGADVVQSATGAMWNANLAKEVKSSI